LLTQVAALGALIAVAMVVYFGLAFAIGGADLGMIRRNLQRGARSSAESPESLSSDGEQ
ncbi:MAG: lipid II flippase MurJ, partial [Rhizobiaceae bacterium]|nr:lipid II flippase MurJ [Rhizobiaceae bacterium]